MPVGYDARHVAAREELRGTLGAIRCAAALLTTRDAEPEDRHLVFAILRAVARGEQALLALAAERRETAERPSRPTPPSSTPA